jgi:DNA repair protein RadD
MNAEEREQVEKVLWSRIPREAWDEFLASDEGAAFFHRLKLVRETLAAAGMAPSGAPPRPVAELLDVYGNRVLCHPDVGPWLRRVLLENMPPTHWEQLREMYPGLAGAQAPRMHRNMTQARSGSEVMAGYWRHGGRWAQAFCEAVGLPSCLAESDGRDLPFDEEVWPSEPLPPLHDFQDEVYDELLRLFGTDGGAAMLSLPTGAGKTRVAVEAVCDHLVSDHLGGRNVVLWIAQSEELQLQAWECFRQVWQVPPERKKRERIKRPGPLRLVCAWGGRNPEGIELDAERTIIIAGIQQLHSWVDRRPEVFDELFPRRRRAAVVVDEAHRIIAEQHRDVLVALGLRAARHWKHPQNAAPVVGLTATPWRTEDGQDESLRAYFETSLLRPDALGDRPIQELQRRQILSKVRYEPLLVAGTPLMTDKQRREFELFHELPSEYLTVLGREIERNTAIVQRLQRLPRGSKALVFACSVEHAELLTLLLNRACGGVYAAVVTGKTRRAQRAAIIEQFRSGDLRFLCNVGVLTTGFDAPKANVVCLTRPTRSALAYEQMVGRGLRGPDNGGTEECLVVDVQDQGLLRDVQSYARVVELWDGGRARREVRK